jgi:transposase-like protein
MQPAKRKLTASNKEAILNMARTGTNAAEIARQLGLNGQSVNGVMMTARNLSAMRTPPMGPRAMPPPAQEDVLKDLAKKWRDSEPDAEFSMHTTKGQKVYIAAYKGGVVLKIGEQKTVALLTPTMATRVSMKLSEMANWSRFP